MSRWRPRPSKPLGSSRRYLGSWVLPSGNGCHAYLALPLPPRGTVRFDGLVCEWDIPPSPAWPHADVEHWQAVTFPEIVRALAAVTGQRVLGVTA